MRNIGINIFVIVLAIFAILGSGCLGNKVIAEKEYPYIISPEANSVAIVHEAGTVNNVKYDWWFAGNYIGTTKSGDAFSNLGFALVRTTICWNSSIPEGIHYVESRMNYNDEFNGKTAIMVISERIEVGSGTKNIRILVINEPEEEKADIYLGSDFVATVKTERTKFPHYQPIFEYNMNTSMFSKKGNYEVHVIGNESREEIGKRTVMMR
jgi:hypothetical protein